MKQYPNNNHPQRGAGIPDLLPARLDVPHVSRLLGFSDYEIPVLVSEGLLEPLGNPAPNAPKFFARVVIEQLAENPAWLHKATAAISKYWRHKRQRQQESHGHDQLETEQEGGNLVAA